jgi:hypothetical protein
MFISNISNKKIGLICFLSLAFFAPGVMAQTTSSSFNEEVNSTSESLRGIQNQSIEPNYDYQRTPKLDVKVEPGQTTSDSGNELIPSSANQNNVNASPNYTLERLNSNQGDSRSKGGTIPFANF